MCCLQEGGRGRGSGVRWANQRQIIPVIGPQTVALCSQQMAGMYTNHRIDRYDHWQQSGTQPILISAPHWSHRSCNAPMQQHRVGKKPSLKADLAIYSQVVDASGQWMSVSLILGFNLDFSSCDHLVDFCKFNHISMVPNFCSAIFS